jgi:hypothetical protein
MSLIVRGAEICAFVDSLRRESINKLGLTDKERRHPYSTHHLPGHNYHMLHSNPSSSSKKLLIISYTTIGWCVQYAHTHIPMEYIWAYIPYPSQGASSDGNQHSSNSNTSCPNTGNLNRKQ